MSLRKAIAQIEKDLKRERSKRIGAVICEQYPNIEFVVVGTKTLTINSISLKDIHVDQYNNFYAKFPKKKFALDLLPVFRGLIQEMFEKPDSYVHRTGIGFFIDYFENYSDDMTVEEIQQMIDWEDADTEKDDFGFGEWLLGTSYSSSGNLSYHRKDIDPSIFRWKKRAN